MLNFTNAGSKPYTIDFGSVQSSSGDTGILFDKHDHQAGIQVGSLVTSDTSITISTGSSVTFLVTEANAPGYEPIE